MGGPVETPSCLLCLSRNSALDSQPSQARRGLREGPGIFPVSWGVVGGQRAWAVVTSGSSSRLESGSWGGSQGAAHLSPGCPSLLHGGIRLPGSPHHPRTPLCRLWPDTAPLRTGWSGGRGVGGEQGNRNSNNVHTPLLCDVYLQSAFASFTGWRNTSWVLILPTPPFCR